MSAHPVGLGRSLCALVVIGVALLCAVMLVFGLAVRADIAPDFEQRIALDARHILVLHKGASRTCASVSSPPQHDCYTPGPERREFSVEYLTPNAGRSLFRFRIAERR